MLFQFYPWKLDIDNEATKQLYIENDYSTDKEVSRKFADNLTEKQADFFRSLKVTPANFMVEEKIWDLSEEGDAKNNQKVRRTSAHFLVCGKFLSIPDFQKELYGGDGVFGKELPENLEILQMPEDEFPACRIDGLGMGIIFKHPGTRFDAPEFQKWDCGYILGSIWTAEDL